MRRDRDGGRARKCQELHADLMVVMKERSGVWLGSPSRRLRVLVALGHQPPGHFFGQPVAHSQPVPRWSHDQAVFRHLWIETPPRGPGLPPRVFPLLFFDGRQGLYAYVETPLWGPGLPPSTAPASLGCYARNSLWAQTKTPAMRWINLGSPENVRRTLPNVTMRTEGAARFGRLV